MRTYQSTSRIKWPICLPFCDVLPDSILAGRFSEQLRLRLLDGGRLAPAGAAADMIQGEGVMSGL
ncbi:hypothetical protein ACWCP6_19020 [Streptomyces sp. NPDC002004]